MSQPDAYHVLRQAAGLLDRSSSRGRIRVTGADRRSYLQGLLTNDIAALSSGNGCYSAYLTPQGRMVADMRVFELGDALLVDLESAVAETVRTRWDQFIFSEDVKVEAVSASTAQVGVYGPRAADVIQSAFTPGRNPIAPSPDAATLNALEMHANRRWDFQGAPATVLRSDDIGVDGFDIVVAGERGGSLVELLASSGGVAISSEAAEICRVEAGRPRFGVDMDEETIPLEAGIEDRAISLTKGCYVGQEIIIRVLHRGHGRVARKLVGVVLDADAEVPGRGEKVFAGDREVGFLTSAVDSPAVGRPIALGYVHRDFVQPGTPVVVQGASATVVALPFVSGGLQSR
jgi:folate-binding protein YgfZ